MTTLEVRPPSEVHRLCAISLAQPRGRRIARASRPALLVLSATLALATSNVNAAGIWATTLKKRDLNGDGVVDAYYDTTLGITWLANMQLAGNPWFMSWTQAKQLVAGLNINGITGWRLPTIDPNSCDWYWDARLCALGPNGKKAELPYMQYVTLGDTSGPFPLGMPVQDGHWFGVTAIDVPDRAYGFFWHHASWSRVNTYLKTLTLYPWPVHQGDVGKPLS